MIEPLDALETKRLMEFMGTCDERRFSKIALIFVRSLIEKGYVTCEQKFVENDDVYLQLTEDGKLIRDTLKSWSEL